MEIRSAGSIQISGIANTFFGNQQVSINSRDVLVTSTNDQIFGNITVTK
jgi:hypothetical protein